MLLSLDRKKRKQIDGYDNDIPTTATGSNPGYKEKVSILMKGDSFNSYQSFEGNY